MKTFKIYFLVLFSFVFISGFYAQDEIYNEKPSREVVDTTALNTDANNFDNYNTEQDYYAKKNNQKNKKEEAKKKERKRENSVWSDIAAEIVVEVVINSIFIIASLWN